jgi:hypothetical protein
MIFDEDLSSVDDGVWKEYEDSKFLIAHISNMKFQRALSRLQQPHRRKLQEGTLDPKVNQAIVCEAMAEGVLRNWGGVKTSKGDDVLYSKANALALLTRDPEFRDWVTEVSTHMANFREEEVEALGED